MISCGRCLRFTETADGQRSGTKITRATKLRKKLKFASCSSCAWCSSCRSVSRGSSLLFSPSPVPKAPRASNDQLWALLAVHRDGRRLTLRHKDHKGHEAHKETEFCFVFFVRLVFFVPERKPWLVSPVLPFSCPEGAGSEQ